MGEIVTLLLLAVALGGLEFRVITHRRNVGTPYNGLGAVAGVLARNSQSPMRYRVLVPWLLKVLFGDDLNLSRPYDRRILLRYQGLKVGLLAAGLVVARALMGMRGALGLGVLLASTFEYDYWDCYAELLGVMLCLSGNVVLVAVGAVVWGLSRETAPLAPILALVASGSAVCGLAGLLAPALAFNVRIVQGEAALYCHRWTWRVYNVPDLKRAWELMDPGVLVSVGWTAVTIGVVVLGWGWGAMPLRLARSAWLALAWIGAGWTLARARETRVFLPSAVWLAAII